MHSPVLLLLLLLLLLVVLCRTTPPAAVAAVAAAAAAVAQPGAEDKALLEQEVSKLRVDVERQPGNAMLQLQLATALHKLNHLSPDGGRRISEAAKAYRAALNGLPADQGSLHINIQGNLGALLLAGSEPEAAIQELEAALQEAQKQQLPLHQFAGLLFNLGKAMTTVGRLQEADETYATAAQAAYGHDLGSYAKAIAAPRSIGEEAAMQAVQVAKAGRLHFQKQQALGFLKDAQLDDAESQQLPQPLKGQQADWIRAAASIELVWLHFAIHKYYHGLKQYDLAWQYLDLGNRIMAVHTPHRHELEEHNLRHIKAIFRDPIISSGLQDDSAIFVVGMPRSGSTLVEQMLASHSQVFAAGEDTALAPLTTGLNKELSKPDADHVKVLRKYGKRYLARMRRLVPKQQWPGSAGQRRIVDKMLRNLWLVGYIQMLLPRACIIHVARHPMDVALSCYAQPFGYSASSLSWAWDLGHIAQQLEMTWQLVEHWQQQLPGRVRTVLYEDLVAHPEQVARELLSGCGLTWEQGVLQFQSTDRPVHTASMVQVRQPLYKSSVGRWKVYEQQLAGLEQRLAPLIARYEQLLQVQMAAHAAPDEQHGASSAAAAALEGEQPSSGAHGDTEAGVGEKGGKELNSKDEL